VALDPALPGSPAVALPSPCTERGMRRTAAALKHEVPVAPVRRSLGMLLVAPTVEVCVVQSDPTCSVWPGAASGMFLRTSALTFRSSPRCRFGVVGSLASGIFPRQLALISVSPGSCGWSVRSGCRSWEFFLGRWR
jgi:hypothetical protein